MEITPQLGSFQPVGDAECGFARDINPCGRPATWHIFWNRFEDHSFACDEHAETAKSWAEYDRHRVGPACSLVGAADIQVWWSWVKPPGGCFWNVATDLQTAEALIDFSLERL